MKIYESFWHDRKAIERDFSVLESAGSHKGKAADNSSAEDSSSSSEEEVYIRNGKEKRRKKLKKKSSKRNEDEKDELAMSLSSQQVPPESKRVEKEMTVLKLDHGESQPSGGKRTNSTSAKQSKREEALLVLETSPASKKKNQFEADVDSFQPNSQNPQESLEGFLELSDEEEKRIYAHKQNIKAYAKKVEKQQSESENSDAEWSRRNGNKSSTSMKQSTPHSSDSDDYNRKLSQSSLTEKKMGAGKLVKRSKRKEEPVPISVVQPPGIVKERSPAIQITAPTATTKAVPVEIIKPSHTEMKRESSKSKKSSSQTPKTSVPSSDEDLPAVLKYGSTTNLDDSEEEAAQVSKLSKPMKMKKVGKTSNNIPKEIDL